MIRSFRFISFLADETVETEIGFLTVDGERQLTIKLSPGCHTNTYVYTFKQVME